ncbi:hypothetical protein [Paludisphaera mucosa]|uniref:Uncharacterized protein n=1 Tax=Paludisphaera mucosa TaxID=3030827 RepID=A0ABT6F5K1_9BACT|nr:hypothetical protein [Paludisphaera mucosa]MDG3002857.1 hypothetical protein [Paludisphaera mucosa]
MKTMSRAKILARDAAGARNALDACDRPKRWLQLVLAESLAAEARARLGWSLELDRYAECRASNLETWRPVDEMLTLSPPLGTR